MKTSSKPHPVPVDCPDYEASRTRRCVHYRAAGGCALASHTRCVEWLRLNPDALKATPAKPDTPLVETASEANVEPARDLFGEPVKTGQPKPAAAKPKRAKRALPVLESQQGSISGPIDSLAGLTTADIASFKAEQIEVQLSSEQWGELWLVPEYTDQSRVEITPEHAATLLRVLTVFPDARVMSLKKPPRSSESASQ